MNRPAETPLNYERAEQPCGCGNPWVLKLWAGWECGNGHALPMPPPTCLANEPWTNPWTEERPSCGWFRHDWDDGDDTLGGACCTSTTRYTCRKCGKTKDRWNGMG